jgi:hypothetical protein
LRLALENPDDYKLRTEIITRFFAAFYRGLWEGAKDFHWVVLGGDHSEGAVVNVTIEGELWPFSEVPMIAPSIGGVQMFVNHPQVVAYFRRQLARFLTSRVSGLLPLGNTDSRMIDEAISELGSTQLTATVGALAGGLPSYDVHFAADGRVEVS